MSITHRTRLLQGNRILLRFLLGTPIPPLDRKGTAPQLPQDSPVLRPAAAHTPRPPPRTPRPPPQTRTPPPPRPAPGSAPPPPWRGQLQGIFYNTGQVNLFLQRGNLMSCR